MSKKIKIKGGKVGVGDWVECVEPYGGYAVGDTIAIDNYFEIFGLEPFMRRHFKKCKPPLSVRIEKARAKLAKLEAQQKPEPKEGEWWMCRMESGNVLPIIRIGSGWGCWEGDEADGDPREVLYKMERAK